MTLDDETVAANAVQEMDRKVTRAKQMLAAVVLAVGGSVRVGQLDVINSRDVVLTIEDDLVTGGIHVTAYRQEQRQ